MRYVPLKSKKLDKKLLKTKKAQINKQSNFLKRKFFRRQPKVVFHMTNYAYYCLQIFLTVHRCIVEPIFGFYTNDLSCALNLIFFKVTDKT